MRDSRLRYQVRVRVRARRRRTNNGKAANALVPESVGIDRHEFSASQLVRASDGLLSCCEQLVA